MCAEDYRFMLLPDLFDRSSGSTECDLTESEVHEILANERRREVIDVVVTIDRITIGRLSDKISDRQNCGRQTVYVALYQNHLELLSKYNVIDYNKDRGTVAAGKNIDALNIIMEDVRSRLN